MVLETDSALDDLLPDVDCEPEGYLVLNTVSGQDVQQPGTEYEQEDYFAMDADPGLDLLLPVVDSEQGSYFANDSGLYIGLKGEDFLLTPVAPPLPVLVRLSHTPYQTD